MSKVTFDYSKAAQFVSGHEVEYMKKLTLDAKEVLLNKSGAGNDFLGWVDLPVDYDKEEFARIKEAAKKIQSDSEVLLVIGIGGSYLGARAAIEFLRHSFYNMVDKSIRKTPEIYFVGNSISSTYIKHLIDVIGDRDFSINMISKSGTTTEPAIAFRVFKEMMEKKYGKEGAAKRIYATTDKVKGSLKNLATEEGYETFVVPDDVGGRFSVLYKKRIRCRLQRQQDFKRRKHLRDRQPLLQCLWLSGHQGTRLCGKGLYRLPEGSASGQNRRIQPVPGGRSFGQDNRN